MTTRIPTPTNRWLAVSLLPLFLLGGCYDGAISVNDSEAEETDSETNSATDTDASSESDSGEEDTGDGIGSEPECVDTKGFFQREVFEPILLQNCYMCHQSGGQAKATDFILLGDEYPGYLEANYNTFANMARLEIDGVPLLLLKPTVDGVEHGGGQRLIKGGDEYNTIAEMISLLDTPVECATRPKAFYDGIDLLDQVETLRKATLILAGRLPTAAELEQAAEDGAEGVGKVLDQVMKEDAFYTHIKMFYNDRLLTDSYDRGSRALNILDPNYPGSDALASPQEVAWANKAIAREPLNIIENVLRKDAPFTEIIEADYTMVNPFSAKAYGLNPAQLGFSNPDNKDEYIEYAFEEFPHAGILTTIAFLNRYPTTPTNLNRARARFVFDFFLGQDVLELAARPIDTGDFTGTPTLENPNCTICHAVIDPVAGAFTHFNDDGWYRPLLMDPAGVTGPGYDGEKMEGDDLARRLPWLTERVAVDDGFALSVVYTLYQGLAGEMPVRRPLDNKAPTYLSDVRAFEAQDATFKALAAEFKRSNYDFRALVKDMVQTPWFRARNYSGPASDLREGELAVIGSSRSLSPELLDAKIEAVFGFQWEREETGTSALLDEDNYRFFYGGIDSRNVTTRLTQVNGVMNNIAERMANEVACRATASDFAMPPELRRLFPHVDPNYEPSGPGLDAIRANIQHLHALILGEYLAIDDPEITHTLELFVAVLEEGRRGIEDEEYSDLLPLACQGLSDPVSGEAIPEPDQIEADPTFTVRAWMAVVTYLLGDYLFLYE